MAQLKTTFFALKIFWETDPVTIAVSIVQQYIDVNSTTTDKRLTKQLLLSP